MTTKSAFQTAHPLSSKKIWKKMLPKLVSILFYAIFISSFLVLILKRVTSADVAGIPIGGANMFSFIPSFAIVFGIIAVVQLVGFYIYYTVYINRYYYDGEDDFLTIKKGVFAPTEIHVQYQRIQDVYVDQDILDRILGIYDVHIASATITSGIEAHIDGVDKQVAESLKNFILAKIKGEQAGGETKKQEAASHATFDSDATVSNETYPFAKNFLAQQIIQAFIVAGVTGIFWSILVGKLVTANIKQPPAIGKFVIFCFPWPTAIKSK